MRQGNSRLVRAPEPWLTIEKLLELCRQFDFAVIRQCVSQLRPYTTLEPLKVFAIASQYDNIALARLASSEYREPQSGPQAGFPFADLKECSKPYLIALIRAVYTCEEQLEQSITFPAWRDAVLRLVP